MKRRVGIALIATVLCACSPPTEIVLGPEPLKQMAEQGAKFKGLSEEDRTLLAGYLTVTEMGKAFGAKGLTPTTGRTVGEVLKDARAWRDKMKSAEAEQVKLHAQAAALRSKVEAERKAISEKLSALVTIAVVDKVVLPKNYDIGRYSELLMVKYALENKSEKGIRQIKGRVEFVDATGDPVGDLAVDIDQRIAPGATIKTDTGSGWRTNGFSNGAIERIANREFSAMKGTFTPLSIAFDDGTVIKAPE
jgi:hypothetical protein